MTLYEHESIGLECGGHRKLAEERNDSSLASGESMALLLS